MQDDFSRFCEGGARPRRANLAGDSHLWVRARLVVLLVTCAAVAIVQPARAEQPVFDTPGGVVEALYRLVTVGAGQTPDWDQIRSLFLDEAVIFIRTSRTESELLSVDGFVADFVEFIERAGVETTGFTERIIRTRPMVFGDIAHVLVLYEASIPGRDRPPQPGVDSFHLIRKGDRWWIASVVNEIPDAERPLPAELVE